MTICRLSALGISSIPFVEQLKSFSVKQVRDVILKYDESLKANQQNIEAISISSYSDKNKEVNARYVNLKFVDDKKFIFFSNYLSPKSKEFNNHNQITALIYWNSINDPYI